MANSLFSSFLKEVDTDPTGVVDAIENTWAFTRDTNLIYYKFGPTVNDWRQLRADDIAITPTTANQGVREPELLTATNTFEFVDTLSKQVFGKDFSFDNFNPSFSTTNGTPQDALIVPFSLPTGANHDVFVMWAAASNTSKNNTTGTLRVNIDGTSVIQDYNIQRDDLYTDGRFFLGFRRFTFASLPAPGNEGNFDVRFQIFRTAGNGTIFVNRMQIAAWRISTDR